MKNRKLRSFLGLTFLLLFAFAMPAYGADDAPRIHRHSLSPLNIALPQAAGVIL